MRVSMMHCTGKQTGPTLELYDAKRERNVDMNSDMIIPHPAEGSHGVRVVARHQEHTSASLSA